MTRFPTSESLFRAAQRYIPGGVNSPVRAFGGVGGHPLFFVRGDGPYVYDADGNRFIDFVASWGPMILGHTPAVVRDAIIRQAHDALGFGAPTQLEIELAQWIVEHIPSIDRVRLVSSGTEATMSAIRLARGFTGRDWLVKFEGCYHGHADSLLVKAGSGVLTFGIPGSPGVPNDIAKLTINLPFNDLSALEACFKQHGDNIAAVIVEPIAGNMNVVLPTPEFLHTLRQQCDAAGAVLIFDEVITGFRVGATGAQGLYGVRPDLTTLGKIIGGGLPVGAYGGREDIMNRVAPVGPVYQAGTLSGNPLAVAAGLATLRATSATGFYERLAQQTQRLTAGLGRIAQDIRAPLRTASTCGMLGLFFTTPDNPLANYQDVARCNSDLYRKLFHALLENGVYLAPSAFEAAFVSAAHTDAVIDEALDRIEVSLKKVMQ